MSEQTKPVRPLSSNLDEIEFLKSIFGSADGTFSLLKSTRNLFLGFDISDSEIEVIRSVFSDEKAKKSLRKKMYPILSSEMPVGEESDFWFGTETEVIDKSPSTIYQVVASKQICLDMLEKAFALLDNPRGEKIDLSYKPRTDLSDTDIQTHNEAFQIGLLARNKYVKTVVTGLAIIKAIAGNPLETAEQAKSRLLQNSTK